MKIQKNKSPLENLKKKLSLLLAIAMILSGLPMAQMIAYADTAPKVTIAEYVQLHNRYDVASGGLTLRGVNLTNVSISFYVDDNPIPIQNFGSRNNISANMITIMFSEAEAKRFAGRIIVGNQDIVITQGSFPVITDSTLSVSTEFYDPALPEADRQAIIFEGANLARIGTNEGGVNITGQFGRSSDLGNFIKGDNFKLINGKYRLIEPRSGVLGFQNVYIKSERTASEVAITNEYRYLDGFRILKKPAAEDIEMYPNTGAKGDEIYFRGTIPGTMSDYRIHFVKAVDGSDPYTNINRATITSLGKEDDKDLLIAKVPEHANFEAGDYRVVITEISSGQIVSELVIPDTYRVIQTSFQPTINTITPARGSDQGSQVTITGNHLLNLNLPNLAYTGTAAHTANNPVQTNGLGTTALEMLYVDNGDGITYQYQNESVTSITRKMDIIIGNSATFTQTFPNRPNQIVVQTGVVDDAEIDPFKDVIVQMETTIVTATSTYVFRQTVIRRNGYEFIPSTYTPEVTSVAPPMIQIENQPETGILNELRSEVLFAIKGQRFFVERAIDPVTGQLVLKYPSVLFKTTTDDIGDIYELAFFPNEGANGHIKYKEGNDYKILLGADGNPLPVEITVLNAQGGIVDGTTNNELGTKLLLRMPKESLVTLGPTVQRGLKRIQLINPRRNTTGFGGTALTDEIVEFVRTTDVPIIETVDPSVVTVEGGEQITVVGSNLQNGMRLFVDGEELTNFTRELDSAGNRIVVRFTAPPGREGITQIAILNPSGGLATSDFTYVRTFNQDPVFNSFTPPSGTAGTLVVANGDNFLRPDPTAPTERGIDAFRLIGTRIFIDGRDANDYNLESANIQFIDYFVPDAQPLLTRTSDGKAAFSPFKDNVTVYLVQTDGPDRVASLTNDASGNPAIDVGSETYSFRHRTVSGNSVYDVYNRAGTLLGTANITETPNGKRHTTTIGINGITLRAEMDNHLVHIGRELGGTPQVFLADYSESVILKSTNDKFTIRTNFQDEIILTNGRDRTYTVMLKGTNQIIARTALGVETVITATNQGISLGGEILNMVTPYVVNENNGRITGHNTRVLSREQLMFNVPQLSTGRGYKDLVIVNPDTKSASKLGNNGFFYIPQATSTPVITTINPSKGSVDGGYFVTISGSDFEDNARVYIDSVPVPVADTYVSLDGRTITIKMPASIKNLNEDFGVDAMDVPVVVINSDGGSASRARGFRYIIPKSDPVIERILPANGSSNGGEIVEILGYEFRFYEPYDDLTVNPQIFEDLNSNGDWDDLLARPLEALVADGIIERHDERTNPYHQYYYTSPILPKIYFGEREARIVEFSRGYIKVITPPNPAGPKDVYVINNDSGVSNKMRYTYATTTPIINQIVPNFGKKQGQEPKDIYGSRMYRSAIMGYMDDDENTIQPLPHVEALVRFGTIDNRNIDRVAPNSGLINNQRTSVRLDGGLEVTYLGQEDKVRVTLTENNVIYQREFTYNDSIVYVPMDMLKNNVGEYYVPFGTKNVDARIHSGNVYEYVRLEIAERRLFVERGYAPRVIYNNENHVVVYTPSYFTIGTVPMRFSNTDGGSTTRPFTYTNPASEPKIYRVEPQELAFDESKWLVMSSVNGGIDIEIIGQDFRAGVEVYIGPYKATVKELTTKIVDGVEYDLIVANVPRGTVNDVEMELPIMVLNQDQGLATSPNIPDLIGPNYGEKTLPIYFVYKQPLSGPRIDNIAPQRTSIAGGNTITITGSDFREGAYVIIGTRAGIPIYNNVISERGTRITFKTPQNMTLGAKTVQVLNNDFGIAIRENGLVVVSAPTVEPVIRDAQGNSLNRIQVTGGQEIYLKGTGFQAGARVYFGGEYLTMKPGDNVPETEQGLFRDDSIRYVKGGLLGTNVQVIDAETIRVTTPEVTFEGDVTVVIRNPDSGITSGDTKIEYTVPIPEDPTGLKAEVVDDRYIKLYDYVAKNAAYFEIYVYIGTKTNAQLINAGYADFGYLGITDIEPYKIIDIPGFDRMATADRLVFVVKAANKFGPSGFSNLAVLTFQDLKDVKELGPPNLDGDIGVAPGLDFEHSHNGGVLKVDFADKIDKPLIEINLQDQVLRNTTIKRIVLPEPLVRSGMNSITVDFGDSKYRFTPVALNTQVFRTAASTPEKAYARITEDTSMNGQRSHLVPNVRGKEQITKVYSIGFDASSNRGVQSFSTLSGTLDFTIKYDASRMTQAKELQIQLYKYNPQRGLYEPVQATVDRNNKTVTARIREAGHYVLMTNR